MNFKALVVLAWLGLSVLVVVRDWQNQPKALQELIGIWLLSIGALVISEASPELGLLAETFVVVDVLLQPGSKDVGQSFAEAVAKVLPQPTTTAATVAAAPQAAQPQGAVI